jgi:hypothetical protein
MKKPIRKHITHNDFLKLSSAESYDTLQVSILVKIDELFRNETESLSFDNYDITFSIPRHSPNPMILHEQNYSYLIELALKAKDPVINVIIIEKVSPNCKVRRY